MTVTATPPASSLPTSVTPSEQNTVSLFDLLLVLVKYRKMIIGIKEIGAKSKELNYLHGKFRPVDMQRFVYLDAFADTGETQAMLLYMEVTADYSSMTGEVVRLQKSTRSKRWDRDSITILN